MEILFLSWVKLLEKNMLYWIIRKKIAVPLVGFVFHREKTMIPYKEFDFLFNEITIPDLEFDFQTPWKSNSEKMRPFFFPKNAIPDLEFHFPTPWDTNLEKFRRFFYPESPILKISCNFSLLGIPIPENSCCFFQLESGISYRFLLF